MTAPEQPTPEALDFLQEHGMWIGLKRVDGVARLLDRFAAQRAAEAVPVSVSDPVRSLVNDIGGCWSAFEHELREVMGNTNYASVAEKIEALRNVPATPPPGDAGERAREIVDSFDCHMIDKRNDWKNSSYNQLVRVIASALQSERAAAASQARQAVEVAERSERNHDTAGDSRGAMVAHNIARNIAALATPHAPREAWQPIETAPKDRSVLVATVGEARYHEDEQDWWWVGTDPTDAHDGQVKYPAYWQPLPEPPRALATPQESRE